MTTETIIWLSVGLVCLSIEILAGMAGYLLWLGISALVVGGINQIVNFDWLGQSLLFVSCALSSTWFWWRFQHQKDRHSDRNSIRPNQLNNQLIGQVGILNTAISANKGRISLNDSSWLASAKEDLPAGTKVKVIAIKGTELVVQKIED